ncbi:MAG: glycoside hydrolase family 3 protein [Lachnospiraceae bacterium]|nr:glycoside hydrolase family 3 protein [Lachnospiraceae bacterium]
MKQGLMRGLAGITASLCAVSLVAAAYAPTRSAFINSRLGTVSYRLEETGETEGDNYYFESEFDSLTDLLAAKQELAEQISAEGTVLLKNENAALPMDASSEKVTLWGHNSVFTARGGMIGSTASAAEGQEDVNLIDAMYARGFQLNEQMIGLLTSDEAFAYTRQTFFPGAGLVPSFEATWEAPAVYIVGEIPASMYTDEVLKSADDTAAVCVITRDSSEAADYEVQMFNGTEGDSFERPLALSQYEKDMIELAKQHSTKVIVLINANNPMELDELKNDPDIDAVVWAGEPGVYGFLGVADVLSGAANPSGHLPDTYAVNSASAPAMQNFGLYMYTNNSQNGSASGDVAQLTTDNKSDWYVVETEGIYQGYKYYETRYEDEILGKGNAAAKDGSSNGGAWSYANEVSYPFGYGSSYTTFEQKLDSVDVKVGEVGSAAVTVTNTGDTAGKSVVELYVQTPYTDGGLEKSAIQLVGFAKTSELAPGASETVNVEIDPALFASYDETVTKTDGTVGAWVLEAGDYYFAIGNGAHNALNNVLANKTGSTDKLISVNADEQISADNAILWTLDTGDFDTYSANVENAIQSADINKLIPDTAEYTTRADWSKGWKTVESITPTADMMVGLTNSTYELTENGEGVTWGADNGMMLINMMQTDENGNFSGVVDFDDPMWDQLVQQVTLDEAIQFIEWAGDDIENIDSVLLPRTYMNDGPLGFAFDQVAGYGTRWTSADSANPTYVDPKSAEAGYSMATMPTEPVVAATWNLELIKREAELYGEDALYAKESICIAPGINLHRTPYCARNHEYYSEDPVLTSLLATQFCEAASAKGLISQTKHFAFNHQELNRSGISTFMTEQAARENELRCFQKVMSTNATGTVMTAFNRIGTTYVGAYSGVLEQIARKEWGYKGGYVTDMVNGAMYMNWLDTVYGGGGTMLGSAANWQGTTLGTMEDAKSKIEKDTAFQQQMQYTIKTWLYSAAQSNVMNGISNSSRIVKVTPWWQSAIYAAAAVTALLTALFLFLGVKAGKKKEA